MNKFEKAIVYVIAAVFSAALIADTILEINGINVPGLFSFALAVCALVLLFAQFKNKQTRKREMVLVALAALISMISGVIQILQ